MGEIFIEVHIGNGFSGDVSGKSSNGDVVISFCFFMVFFFCRIVFRSFVIFIIGRIGFGFFIGRIVILIFLFLFILILIFLFLFIFVFIFTFTNVVVGGGAMTTTTVFFGDGGDGGDVIFVEDELGVGGEGEGSGGGGGGEDAEDKLVEAANGIAAADAKLRARGGNNKFLRRRRRRTRVQPKSTFFFSIPVWLFGSTVWSTATVWSKTMRCGVEGVELLKFSVEMGEDAGASGVSFKVDEEEMFEENVTEGVEGGGGGSAEKVPVENSDGFKVGLPGEDANGGFFGESVVDAAD